MGLFKRRKEKREREIREAAEKLVAGQRAAEEAAAQERADAFDDAPLDQELAIDLKHGRTLIDSLEGELKGDERVLDLGCGRGATTLELWKRHPDLHITAIDFSEQLVGEAHGRYEKARAELTAGQGHELAGGIEFRVLDIARLDYHGEFDLVFSNAALHHVGDPQYVYSGIFDALKAHGLIALQQEGYGANADLHKYAVKAAESLGIAELFPQADGDVLYPFFMEPTHRLITYLEDYLGFLDLQIDKLVCGPYESDQLVDWFVSEQLCYYERLIWRKPHAEEICKRLGREFFRLASIGEVHRKTVPHLFVHARKPAPGETQHHEKRTMWHLVEDA